MAKPRTTYEPKATGHYTKPAAAGKKKMAYSKSVENLKGGTGGKLKGIKSSGARELSAPCVSGSSSSARDGARGEVY